MSNGLKSCCNCKVDKPLDAFGRLSEAKDGLTYACLDCTRAKMAAWRAANRERDRAAKQRWAKDNSDKIKEKSKRYYAENKEAHQARCNDWATRNKAKVAKNFAKRRAIKRNAMPSWLSAIELAQIQEMYDVAAAKTIQTGIKHHVDHIHPLQGNCFNGLHVPWNLRVIEAQKNIIKSNKPDAEELHLFWEDLL